jgi:phage repressor protein C with HTH and peptisase S24 domain
MVMSNTDPRDVLERLIKERREDYASLSRLLGRNAAYVHQYIHRGSPKRLREEDRKTLARYFGVADSFLSGQAAPDHEQQPDSQLIPIPRFDISASAGPGALEGLEQPIAHIGFSRSWLEQLCRARPHELSLIQVRGDSMFPSLSDGDDMMVDRSDGAARLREGIYVIRLDEALVVKRLSVNPVSKRLTVASDNHAYPSWQNLKPGSIDVIGRVVWAGRKIS